jgi:hypothetical protein
MGPGVDGFVKDLVGKPRTLDDGRPGGFYVPRFRNLKDKQNFSRYYPKRLKAEVLYDALHQVTATTQGYSGLPAGTMALQLPDPTVGPYFLKVFGQPQADTACECERSQEANCASPYPLNSSRCKERFPAARRALLSGEGSTDEERAGL